MIVLVKFSAVMAKTSKAVGSHREAIRAKEIIINRAKLTGSYRGLSSSSFSYYYFSFSSEQSESS